MTIYFMFNYLKPMYLWLFVHLNSCSLCVGLYVHVLNILQVHIKYDLVSFVNNYMKNHSGIDMYMYSYIYSIVFCYVYVWV